MKSFFVFAFFVSVSLMARAADVDTSYDGRVTSMSKTVSVKYADGSIQTFDVSDIVNGTVDDRSYMKVASLKSAHPKSNCTKMIGELASDYSFKMKTDENEVVTVNFKASNPSSVIRISGDCENKISGEFSLYGPNDQPLPFKVSMSSEAVGAPAPNARYVGRIVKVSPTVSVRDKNGTVHVLNSSGLAFAGLYNGMHSVLLSSTQTASACGDSLGDLASNFAVTVKTARGMVRTAVLRAASEYAPEQEQVRVYGSCAGKDLSQLQLDTQNKALFNIQ